MNDIKARIKSVESTMQITKAMELVATSKLRRARERAEASRPFISVLSESIDKIIGLSSLTDGTWTAERQGKTLYIVIAGDRGLAGGYNANIFRLTKDLAEDRDCLYFPIGKKALEHYKHRNMPIVSDKYEYTSEADVSSSLKISEEICRMYREGEISSVYLVYTEFTSMMTQTPRSVKLLPINREGIRTDKAPEYDGSCEQILDSIIPQYIGGIIYSSVCESLASESGARRSAMNSANKNASEMIDTLMLSFNRARQAVITQEITEIVSGAEAQ